MKITMAGPLAVALILAAASAGASGDAAAQGSKPIRIRFEARVGAQPFHCGQTYQNVGLGGATITPEYFRFYVSAVKLIAANGKRVSLALAQDGTWQRRDVAFLSFEDPGSDCANGSPQRRVEIDGFAPAQNYSGIEFVLGIPDDLDHADATIAQSPLNLSDMFWSWQDGYKFLRFEARVQASGRSASYVFHLGSTGCTLQGRSALCSSPNRTTIELRGFNPSANVIVADVGSLFRNADLTQLAANGGCMSGARDACQPVMRDLGITFAGQASAQQRLFSVR